MRTLPSSARLAAAAAGLLVVLLTLAPQAALAQWKWKDKDGRVTVSDRPPPREVPDKDILSRPDPRRLPPPPPAPAVAAAGATAAPAAAAASAPSTPLEREVQARKRAEEQERAAKARADEERLAQQRAENCRLARGHVAALESGQRIARTNDKGEREVLDDKGRADELRRAREVMASDCR